ncbi:hypothetical protein D3C84_1188220 [compost metagenome]
MHQVNQLFAPQPLLERCFVLRFEQVLQLRVTTAQGNGFQDGRGDPGDFQVLAQGSGQRHVGLALEADQPPAIQTGRREQLVHQRRTVARPHA